MPERRLRIAMIGLRGLPATWGGVERHVEELGARLAARGHEVTAFCRAGYSDPGIATHRGIRLEVLRTVHARGAEALTHSLASAARTLNADYDVVHFHAIGPGIAAVLPRYLSKAAVVQTIHGLDADRLKWGAAERIVLRAGALMSGHVPQATVTVSRSLQTHYRDHYGRSATYIPNGAPAPVLIGPERLSQRFGVEAGQYLLFVGRLVPEKAPDVLLKAFASLPGNLQLVIAGGSSDTEAFTQQVQRLARQDDRVVMPGYVFGDDLAALYGHARAFVLPSLLEGMPLTLLEAVSYGLPVIASSIPPHVEVIGEEGAGARLARPGDVAALRQALERALADDTAEREGADTRRRQALLQYDWDKATDLLELLYADLVRRGAQIPLQRTGEGNQLTPYPRSRGGFGGLSVRNPGAAVEAPAAARAPSPR